MLYEVITAIAKRDSDTDIHNFRVTLYAIRLAEAMGLENATIQTIIKGAFLHDVGRITSYNVCYTKLLRPVGQVGAAAGNEVEPGQWTDPVHALRIAKRPVIGKFKVGPGFHRLGDDLLIETRVTILHDRMPGA